MGKREARGVRIEDLMDAIKGLESELGGVEAVIIYGSAARGGMGVWSDVDILIVSDGFRGLNLLDRISLLMEHMQHPMEALGYTYHELARMVDRANALALNALIDGRVVLASRRVLELRERASKMFRRRGRMWIPTGQSP